ncbi:MAG: hypothetical protein IIY58_00485, partial [Aeriscardovia sp.]|nr:hypothetical protein [Aeriscardovia sp.]
MKQTQSPPSRQGAAGPSIHGSAAFSGDTLFLSLPAAPQGPLTLLLCPPGKQEGPSFPLTVQGEAYHAEGLYKALSSLGPDQATDYELLLLTPQGRFSLENQKAAKDNAPLQKGLLSWAEGSMASSPLPFSVLEGERSIVECALPYLDIERERPLYPVTYLTKEGRFFLSLATQRAFLLKTSLCSLKRLSLFGKRLRLSLETNVEKDEADLALLYETSSEEKSALIYFRERPQEEQGIAEEAGQKTVEIEGQKGEAKAETKEIQEEKERTSKEKRGFYQFTETLSLGSAPLKRSSWIPALFVSTKEGEEVALPIHMSYPQRFFYNYLYKGRYRRKGRFLYPVNTDEGTLSFQYRPIEKEDRLPFHLKELLALVLYRLRKRHYDKQHIQLIFERNSQSARENGFYYFMHCLENGEEEKENVKLYYVIGENSNDLPRLAPYMDHVVYYESLRHMICLIVAKLLV